MKFDDFLATYHQFVQKKMNDTLYAEDIVQFLKQLEIAIEAYAEISFDMKHDYQRWEAKAKRLAELRSETKKLSLKEPLK